MITILDKKFIEIEKTLGIQSPTNLKEEKFKFFNSGYKYNPVFEYEEKFPNMDFKDLYNEADKVGNKSIKELYYKKIDEYKIREKIVLEVGKSPDLITSLLKEVHGELNPETVDIAYKILDDIPNLNFSKRDRKYLRFKKIKKDLNEHLKKNKYKGRIVVNKDKTVLNNVSVSKVTGNLKISNNYIADKDEFIDIIYHEIETHMKRLENGWRSKYGIFAIGTKGYLKYEECLATITGHSMKQNKNLWHPALLLIGTHIAQKSDFISVFKEINKYVKNPFRSWSYSMRVKRGVSDTGQPGAYMGDLYLEWLVKYGRELINEPDLLQTAYSGKASFQELRDINIANSTTSPITIDDVRAVFDSNYISY